MMNLTLRFGTPTHTVMKAEVIRSSLTETSGRGKRAKTIHIFHVRIDGKWFTDFYRHSESFPSPEKIWQSAWAYFYGGR